MRFISSKCLKLGMIIAKDLYGFDNNLLLRNGEILCEIQIKRINSLQIQGIYITDDHDVEVEDVISAKLRNDTVKSVKDVFEQLEDKNKDTASTIKIVKLKNSVNEIIDRITTNKDAVINMLDLKAYSDNTYYHCFNVAILSLAMAVSIGLDRNHLYELGLGALLHDIGKVFIPINILEKKSKLDYDEYNIIKEHALKGSDYVKYIWNIPLESNIAILNHHEKYDGSGYPYKLKGDKISLFGKIIAVADVFDALTSIRSYREAFSPSEAIEYIMGGSGTHFDPVVVEIFAKTVIPYPVGTVVILSNNLKGIVVGNYQCCSMRPKIKLLDKDNDDNEVYYDLFKDKNLFNVTIKGVSDN